MNPQTWVQLGTRIGTPACRRGTGWGSVGAVVPIDSKPPAQPRVSRWLIDGELKSLKEWVDDPRNTRKLTREGLKSRLVRAAKADRDFTLAELQQPKNNSGKKARRQRKAGAGRKALLWEIEGERKTLAEWAADPRNVRGLKAQTLRNYLMDADEKGKPYTLADLQAVRHG